VLIDGVLVNNLLVNDKGRAGATLEMPLMDHLTNNWWDRCPFSPGHINQWVHGSLKCSDCGERGVRCNRSDDAAGQPSATKFFAALIPPGWREQRPRRRRQCRPKFRERQRSKSARANLSRDQYVCLLFLLVVTKPFRVQANAVSCAP
jgi:hypothetical protein